jgi:hypothetical protein
VDFDVTGNVFNQGGDYRMGNGIVRPATTYKTYDGSARVGADLSNAWRVDGRVNGYLGRDIDNPGDVFTGTSSQGARTRAIRGCAPPASFGRISSRRPTSWRSGVLSTFEPPTR